MPKKFYETDSNCQSHKHYFGINLEPYFCKRTILLMQTIVVYVEKNSRLQKQFLKFMLKMFYEIGSIGQSHKKNFGINLRHAFCKLYRFIAIQQILLLFIKWARLQKSVSKYFQLKHSANFKYPPSITYKTFFSLCDDMDTVWPCQTFSPQSNICG